MASPRFIHWLPVPAACLALWVLGSIHSETEPGKTAHTLPGPTSAFTGDPATAAQWAAEAQRLWALVAEAQSPEDKEAAQARWLAHLERWIAAHPQEAAEYLESRGLLSRMEKPLLQAWARQDAASFLAWVEAGDDERSIWWMNCACADLLAQAWMEHDPDAAWAWVNAGGHDVPGLEQEIVLRRFASATVEEITAWYQAPNAKISAAARCAAIELVARHYQRQGHADAALAWMDTLTRTEDRSYAALVILPPLTTLAPERAVQWLASQSLPEISPFSRTAAMIDYLIKAPLRRWVDRDAAAAGEWINSHRDSPQAPALIEGYAMSIAGEDPAAAREWLAQLPAETALGHLNPVGSMRPVKRADLERLIDLAQICALALEDPARGIALAQSAFPGNAAALTHYKIELVRNAPGTPPVPLLTPHHPDAAQLIYYSWTNMPTQIMVRGPDGTLTPEPPSAKTIALVQAIQAHQAAQAASAAQAQAPQAGTTEQ